MDIEKYNRYQSMVVNSLENGRFSDAIGYIDKMLLMNPNDPQLLNEKGNAHMDLSQSKKALDCYDKAISLNHLDPILWHNKGFALFRLSEFKDAIICLDQAFKLDPSLNIYVDKGFCLEKLGNSDEALFFYDQALKLNPFDEVAIKYKENLLNSIQKEKEEDKFLNSGFDGLIKGLKSENVVIRRKSVKALGRLKNKKSIFVLKKSLNDDDFHVRKYAKESLDQIKIDCPMCNSVNDYNEVVCRECGYDLKIIEEIDENINEIKNYVLKCSDCGFENLKNARFCSGCGNKLESNISMDNSNFIDINSVTEDKIASIPSIGPILAKKAVKIRESKGGFESVEDFCISLELKPHTAKNLESLIICNVFEKTEKLKENESPRRIVDF